MDLSYFNARIKGLKGRLLGAEDYAALVTALSMSEYIERLRPTAYGPDISSAQARFEPSYDLISTALRRNLTRTFALIWKTVPDDARPLVSAFLSVWDAHNLKTLIRGIAKGVKRESLEEALVPMGELDWPALNILMHARGVPDLVDYLATWGSPYSRPLRAGLRQYTEKSSLIDMEVNLDLFVYSRAIERIGKRGPDSRVALEDLRFRIDSSNILTLLKTTGEGFSKEGVMSFFIEGGDISRGTFSYLTGFGRRDEVLNNMIERLGRSELRGVLSKTDPENITALEERLAQVAQKRLSRIAVAEPLSIAVAASYIYLKIRETKNLRAIARGIAFGFPPDELQELIHFPRLD